MRLGTLPLSDSITSKIVAKKGDIARKQCEAAEKQLLTSKLLPEKAVPFFEDDARFELNWLGDAPFMQTQIACSQHSTKGKTLCDCDEQPGEEDKPRALALHVQLSEKTFLSGLEKIKTNLKIDVFFNGELASCVFIPVHDIRSGTKSLHQVFAGTRVGYLAERPWIILSSSHMLSDESRFKDVTSPVEERWLAIGHALQSEVQARGTNHHGSIPPSAEFLRALASLQMPQEVRDMQQPGYRSFGIIDVVISAGNGRKITSGLSYLNAPQRLVDDNFPLDVKGNQLGLQSRGASIDATSSPAPDQDLNIFNAEEDSDCKYKPRSKRQALAPCAPSQDQIPSATSRCKYGPTAWPSQISFQDTAAMGQQRSPQRLIGDVSSSIGHRSSSLQHYFSNPYGSLLGFSPSAPAGYSTQVEKTKDLYGMHGSPSEFNESFFNRPREEVHGIAPVAPMYPWVVSTLPTMHPHLLNSWMHHDPTRLPRFSCLSSYSHVPSELLPPTGLYSVPQKPQIKFPSTKPQDMVLEKESRLNVLITRLVIYGQNGPVIDHQWAKAQRMPLRHKSPTAAHPRLRIVNDSASTSHIISPNSSPENSKPSVEFRKSNSSLVDDSEEMPRETPSGHESSTYNVDSAPVSSAPDMPEVLPMTLSRPHPSQWRPTINPQAESNIVQLSSPSSGMPTTFPNPTLQTPPPSSSLSSANSQSEPTPTSSPPLNPKKRKTPSTHSGTLTRKPRDPNRTINPPLNKNCVIAYAEGDTAHHPTEGPLRQIRGERQGVFHEDYVVFAARIFVPGNYAG